MGLHAGMGAPAGLAVLLVGLATLGYFWVGVDGMFYGLICAVSAAVVVFVVMLDLGGEAIESERLKARKGGEE